MKKGAIEKVILRMLLQRELSGYDIYKELAMKGVKIRSNYLYMILTAMHDRGILRDHWVEGRNGPRRRLYSLSKKGEEEFRVLLKESVELVMDAFVHANLAAQDLPDHSNAVRALFAYGGIPPPTNGSKFVVTVPPFDPLICYPIAFYVLSETFPDASVFVIKPPGVKLQEDRSNLTFLDGWRHDMPLKDGFADYLMLEGFPENSSEEDVISECNRVLKDAGHLIIRHPSVMTDEKKPKFSTLGEFASRLFYDISEQDRTISVERVKQLLSRHYKKLNNIESHGNAVLFASGKKRVNGFTALKQRESHAPVQIRR